MSNLEIIENAVVLISGAANQSTFGTGFAIAEDADSSYVISCAHVLEEIGGQAQIGGHPAEILARGSSTGLDLALLKVAKLNIPCLNQFAQGIGSSSITTTGFSGFDSGLAKRTLSGILGKTSKLADSGNSGKEFAVFDVNIKDDEFSKLEPGYSGSPLCNSAGAVIGVISHRRNGEQGHAFCISNLQFLYETITELVPEFKPIGNNLRINRIRQRLLSRTKEIVGIYQPLFAWLKQVEQHGIEKNDEILLDTCEHFVRGEMDAEGFEAAYQSIASPPPHDSAPAPRFNYSLLAENLLNGNVVLCLGAELPSLPDARSSLLQKIPALDDFKQQDKQYALSELCEYAELHDDCRRLKLLAVLRQILTPRQPQPAHAITQLLAGIDVPLIIVATGYDTALAEQLQRQGRRFALIVADPSTPKTDERYQLSFRDGRPDQACSDERLSTIQLLEEGYSILYYPRGYIHPQQDSLLLSERDYFNAADLLNKRYPAYLHNKIKSRSLWFIGHHPDSWENRLLALGLQHQRLHNREKPLVIQPQPDTFSKLFWQDMACQYDETLSLEIFAKGLEQAMAILNQG